MHTVAGGCERNRCCHLHAKATAWGYGVQAGTDLWCYVHWCPLPDLHSPASLAATGFVLGSCKLCTTQLLPFNFGTLHWWLPWMVMRLELSGLGNPWREAGDVECYNGTFLRMFMRKVTLGHGIKESLDVVTWLKTKVGKCKRGELSLGPTNTPPLPPLKKTPKSAIPIMNHTYSVWPEVKLVLWQCWLVHYWFKFFPWFLTVSVYKITELWWLHFTGEFALDTTDDVCVEFLPQVSQNLLWLSSNLSSLPAPLLAEAQVDSRATKRLVHSPQQVLLSLLSF